MKILKKSLMMLMVMMVAMAFNSCGDSHSMVQTYANKLNDMCPMDMGTMKWEKVQMEGNDVVMTFTFDEAVLPVAQMPAAEKAFADSFVGTLKGNADLVNVLDAMDDIGGGMVVRFQGNNGYKGETKISTKDLR